MTQRVFTKDQLVNEFDLPWNDDMVKSNDMYETSRWSIHYILVFEHEGKFWRTTYAVGATESQDEGPWEYDDEVTCIEVEEQERMVKYWAEV